MAESSIREFPRTEPSRGAPPKRRIRRHRIWPATFHGALTAHRATANRVRAKRIRIFRHEKKQSACSAVDNLPRLSENPVGELP